MNGHSNARSIAKIYDIFVKEQIELQAHGTYVAYRNIYIRELPSNEPTKLSDLEKQQGFKQLFDGTHLDNWVGNKAGYLLQDGSIMVNPKSAGGGNLYTKDEYLLGGVTTGIRDVILTPSDAKIALFLGLFDMI